MMYAPFIITAIAFSLTILRSVAQYFMIDQAKMKIYRRKIEEWQEKRQEAKEKQDPRLLRKVKAQQSKIQKFQTEMSKARMKPMCLFMVPFLIVFWAIQWLFSQPIPMGIQIPINWVTKRFFTQAGEINVVWFYVLTNIASNTIVRVIFQFLGLLEKRAGGMGGMGMSGMGQR